MVVNGTGRHNEVGLQEIGVTGVVRSAGHIDDELLPELRGRNKINVIKQMTQNDAVIGALTFAFKMLIRQMKFRIDPASQDNAALEAADFIDGAMFHDMSMSWKSTISDVVSFLWWGYSYHEVVYKIRDGDSADPSHRSRFNDGKIGWRKWPIRSQDTLWEWKFDENGGVQAFVQVAPPDYSTRIIPIEKALLFQTESNRGNPEGLSILRTAYRSWRYKTRIENIEAIGVERDLVGYPVAWLPPSYMAADATPAQKSIYEYTKKMVTAMRRDQWEGAVMPTQYDEHGNKLFDVTLLSTGGSRQFDTGAIITRYDQRMLMSVLADFMLLGAQQHGSWALSSDKTDLFAVALGAWVDGICDVINTHGIPRLTRLNGMPQELNPVLAHEDISSKDAKEFAESVSKLITSGALTPDAGLENAVRETMELPPLEEMTVP